MEKSESGKIKKKLFSRFLLILVVLIFAVAVVGIFREYAKSHEVDSEISGLQEELNRLKLEKNSFLKSIDSFQSDFFLEQEARLKFNLKKDGEKAVVIPANNILIVNEVGKNNDSILALDDKVMAWQKAGAWWSYFFADKD